MTPFVRWLAQPWRSMIALVLLATAVYANSLGGVYVLDDIRVFTARDGWRELEQNSRTWSTMARPVTAWTFLANRALAGDSPANLRAGNILIHISAGLVLFALIRRVIDRSRLAEPHCPDKRPTEAKHPAASSKRRQPQPGGPDSLSLNGSASLWAFLIAAAWLVHPLQTESVTYVIQRSEALAGLWSLVAVWCHLRAADTQVHKAWWSAAVLAAVMLSIGSKQVGIATPVLLLVADRCFLSTSWTELVRRRWWVHLSTSAIAAAAVAGVYMSGGFLQAGQPPLATVADTDSPASDPGLTPVNYLRTQSLVLAAYVRWAVWPDVLCLDRGWRVLDSNLAVVAAGIFWSVLLALSLRSLISGRVWGGLGIAWFATLAPSSSIVPIRDLAVEHRMYLPLAFLIMGAAMALGQLVASIAGIRRPMASGGLILSAFAIVIALGARTMVRNHDYGDAVRFWRSTVDAAPTNVRPRLYLGTTLQQLGRLGEAEEQLRVAIRLLDADPRPPRPTDNERSAVYNMLGVVTLAQHQLDVAREALLQSERLTPDLASNQINLAVLELRENRLDAARQRLQRLLKRQPDVIDARFNLGLVAWRQKSFADARTAFAEVVRQQPGNSAAWRYRGLCEEKLGQLDTANRSLRRATECAPFDGNAAMAYGDFLRRLNRYGEAEPQYAAAARQQPRDAAGLVKRAEMLIRLGRLSEARQVYASALKRLPPQDPLAAQIRGWLTPGQQE